jgi:hypothetical protein
VTSEVAAILERYILVARDVTLLSSGPPYKTKY